MLLSWWRIIGLLFIMQFCFMRVLWVSECFPLRFLSIYTALCIVFQMSGRILFFVAVPVYMVGALSLPFVSGGAQRGVPCFCGMKPDVGRMETYISWVVVILRWRAVARPLSVISALMFGAER